MLVLILLDSDDQAAYPLAVSIDDNLEGLQEVARIEFASTVDPLDESPVPNWERKVSDNGVWWIWEASDANTYTIEEPVNSELV
jgi:hypothetical protein